MFTIPFFSTLEPSQRILIAGAGGGFDLFCGLPLYFALQDSGKQVFLANLSFTTLPPEPHARLAPALLPVTANTPCQVDYFPEHHLADWFRHIGSESTIYCFERVGVQPLLEAYRVLVEHLAIDTIILVDGGTDSLLRGDEVSLGSPHEDAVSLTVVDALPVERKLLVCLGFGVDRHHGVCHADCLEAVAYLTQFGGYLGMFSLTNDMPAVQQYRAATEAVFQAMPGHESIVNSSVLAALDGQYGDYHATQRTRGTRLWINPLMPVYWCFEVAPVAARLLYRSDLWLTQSYADVWQVIGAFRSRCAAARALRPRSDIPL
jgi:hypothetical protein